MDLGECTKIHDLALRADYEIASKERDLFFELDVSFILCWFVSTVKSQIPANKNKNVTFVSYAAE